jgi:hypothetical protein
MFKLKFISFPTICQEFYFEMSATLCETIGYKP